MIAVVPRVFGSPWRRACAVVLAILSCLGCGERPASKTSSGRTVVVYSSADKEFAELIFRAYEQKTGVKVSPLYDTEETKTAGLTARLVAEKANPIGDIGYFGVGFGIKAKAQDALEAPVVRVQHAIEESLREATHATRLHLLFSVRANETTAQHRRESERDESRHQHRFSCAARENTGVPFLCKAVKNMNSVCHANPHY